MAITLKNKADGVSSKYATHLKAAPAKATTTVEKKQSGVLAVSQESQELLHKGIMASADQMAKVYVSGSTTINLGNYESAKITVGIEMPSNVSDINETYEFSTQWVSERIAKAVSEAKGEK